MSLINKFWQTLEDKQESLGPPPDGLDAIWRVVKPAPEDRSRPARELSRLARLCMRKRPPALLSQPSVELHPFVMILSAPEHVLPTFEELYEGYLDKNGYLAECLMLLKPHCDVPYALFAGPQHFFLYDLFTEDILRWSGEVQELESLLIAPLEQRDVERLRHREQEEHAV